MPLSYAKRLAYEANAHAVGCRWRDYAQLAAIMFVIGTLAAGTPDWPAKSFVAGAGIGALAMTMALSTLRLHDPQVLGYVAKTFSLEALGKVRGWAVIDNLPFDRVDIDHVVITPATVLAVETKHHGYLPPSHPTAHRRARRDREAALASARNLRSLLRSKKLHDAASVTAVLMIWGPGAPEFEQGYRVVDDVYVVNGRHPELWRHLFSAPVLRKDTRALIEQAVREFSRARDSHEGAKSQPMWRLLITELAGGVREERAARSVRRAQEASIRSRHAQAREAA